MSKIADVDIRIKQGKEHVEECFDEVLYLIGNLSYVVNNIS